MIWWLFENWFWIGIGGGYLAAIVFAYARFGKEAAIAVATAGGAVLLYRLGRSHERDHYEDHISELSEERQDAYDQIDNRGTDRNDAAERMRRGDY
ncbi:hypothetical protein [Pelagibacterium sp.]|uniref:hypothetical protein n=1 Tax=Pelagibacterium sp. TaxID=1967288 RepID=UPI003A911D5D